MNIFKCLFTSANWYPVWTKSATWNISYTDIDAEYQEFCEYTICYSKKYNDYKLEMSGYQPRKHSYYEWAVKHLNEYKNSLTNKP